MYKPKPTAVIAVTALCVAVLGSTPIGHAAARLVVPKNSVGTTQLKTQAVTGAKVKDGSLTAADFGAGQLPAGPQGPAGPAGPKGAPGAPGAPGLSDVQQITGLLGQVPNGQTRESTATCPTGKIAIGGGYSADSGLRVLASNRISATTWYVRAESAGNGWAVFSPYVMCAVVAS